MFVVWCINPQQLQVFRELRRPKPLYLVQTFHSQPIPRKAWSTNTWNLYRRVPYVKKMIFVLISVTFLFVSVSVINSTTDRPERERTNIFQGNNTTMTRYITFVQYTAVMNYLQSTTTIHTCWTIFSCGNVFSIHSTWHSFSSGE